MSTNAPERLSPRPPLRAAVAEEVRALLARRRMSAIELSRRIGKSHTYVGRRLSAETAFDTDDLEQIAGVLGVSVVDLLGHRATEPDALMARREPSPWKASDAPPAAPEAPLPTAAPRPSDRRPVGHPVSRRPPAGPGRTSRVQHPTTA